jgi:C4-type Zn-finger protein
LDGSASSDPDGTIASYQWAQNDGPSTATLSNANAAKSDVSGLSAGTYGFTLIVKDDKGASAKGIVTVTVNDAANKTPVADPGKDQSITLPTNSVSLDGSASSDPDGTIASYQWAQNDGPSTAILNDANAAKADVSGLSAGTYDFTLTVKDDKGASAKGNVTITVNDAANKAPVADAGSNQSITLPRNSVILDGSASNQADGVISTYHWDEKSGPSAFKFQDANSVKTKVTGLVKGVYIFTLTVENSKGISNSTDIVITVNGTEPKGNQAHPVADAGPDITTVMPLNLTTLDGTGTIDKNNANGYIFYYWEKISGPVQFRIQFPNKPITNVDNLVVGTYKFKLTIRINSGPSVTDTVQVTVKPDPITPGDVPFTANTEVTPYTGSFQYGTNPSSYGNGWVDTAIAGISLKAGAHSLRLPLPDAFVGHYGYNIRVNEFNYYTHHLGMKDITLFVGGPRPEYRDNNIYPPATDASKVFDHLYESIWDNGENGTPINDNNYFAVYIYNLAKRYGKNVKFWEIVNEPDATGFWDNGTKSRKDSWYNSTPNADALLNLKAPIFYYIRMLRIAYEVIKKIDPQDYVAPGGIGYPAFLDALLRYTDNPDGGKVTTKFPFTGGAYFDVVSFHSYPAYNLKLWDNSIGGFRWFRYSDRAANAVINLKDSFESILTSHGYNGKKFPKKPFIITECNLPSKSFGTYFGSVDAQRNFIIKELVKAQENDIKQFYIYEIGETADPNTATQAYDLMGLYENLKRDKPGQEKLTTEGQAYKTTSMLLYGWQYDSVQTKKLNLPNTIDGAAFKKGDEFRYVLWAKTHTDLSEKASATYSLPSSFNADSLYRYEWNYSVDPKAMSHIRSQEIALTGTPSFFTVEKATDTTNRQPVADAGDNKTINLPSNSVTLSGSASMDPDGSITAYKWTKTSGPSSFSFDNTNKVETNITSLVAGVYSFTLTVTDNKGATSSDNVTVTVNGISNKSPIPNAGKDLTITLPVNTVTLDGSASLDPDGAINTYNWVKKSGPASFQITNPTAAKTNVTGLSAGTYVFTLTVSDNRGAKSSSNVTIIVNAASNKSPKANAGSNQAITLPVNMVTLDGSASSDPDGTIKTYKWSKKSGPTSFTFDNANAAKTKVSGLISGTYTFTLTVKDNKGASASDDMIVTVHNAVNQSPIAKAGNDQSITLPKNSINLDGSASSDPDGTIKSYQWTKQSGPASAAITDAKAAKATATGLTLGTYVFKLKVTDKDGATATDEVTVNVNENPNKSPIAQAGKDIAITLPLNAVTLDGSTSSDPDGKIVAYKWTKESGPASAILGDAKAVSTKITDLTTGTYIFSLTVTDNKGASTSDDVTITVNPAVNQSPIAKAGITQTITLPQNSVTLDGSASSDPDGTIKSYQWSQKSGPAPATITNANAATTKVEDLIAGTYVYTLNVSDNDGADANDEIIIIVNKEPNQPPVANAGKDLSITLPLNSATLNGSASSDPDGNIVSYEWGEKSGPSSFTFGDAGIVNTKVTDLTQGVYTFTLTVEDNKGEKATDDVIVTVEQPAKGANKTPVARAGNNQTIKLPVNSLSLDGSTSSDPDGSIKSYHWTKKSGPSSFSFGDANTSKTEVSGLEAGTYVFTLTVTDDQGAKANDNVTIVVEDAPNLPPTANAGKNESITLPVNSVTLNGSTSSDPDGTITSYLWTKKSGPTNVKISNNTAATTKVEGLVAGTYIFNLTVTDNQGAIASSSVVIKVNPQINQSPIADAGKDQSIQLPENSVTLTGSGSNDPDGTIASYQWTKKSGPDAATISNKTSSNTKVTGLIAGTYVFNLMVTDNQGATASSAVTVVVNAKGNLPPIVKAGKDQSIQLPKNSVMLDGSGSTDSDGSISSYQWTQKSGPSSAAINYDTAATTKVSDLIAGKYVFKLTITDNQGAKTSSEISITVLPEDTVLNEDPVAVAGKDQAITLPDNSLVLDGTASSDPDGSIKTYKWVKKSGPSSFTIAKANSAKTNVTDLASGNYVFTLIVTDNQGASDSDNVKVIISQENITPNRPPNAIAGKNQSITLPVNTVTLDGSASSDPEGNITSYQWEKTSGPEASFSDDKVAKTDVNGLEKGTYVFKLTVTNDQGESASADVTIVVNAAPNEAPIAKAGANQIITLPKNSVTLDGSASTDPDGNIKSYKWTKNSGPDAFTFSNDNASKSEVTGLKVGTYVFTLAVTDDQGKNASADVTVTVKKAPNKPPVANAGGNQNIYLPDNSAMLDGSTSSDTDGDITTYQWSQKSGPSKAKINGDSTAKAQVNDLANGKYVFTLIVSDNEGAKDTAEVTIGVYNTPNASPIANAGRDSVLVIPENSTLLDGSTSHDPDGRIVNYHWEALTGPVQAVLSDPNGPLCTVTGLTQMGTYDFKLTVTDNRGATSSASVSVYVVPGKDTIKTTFKIYPNPVHDELHIDLNKSTTGLLTFRIMDVSGRVLKVYRLGALPIHINKVLDVSSLPNGIYFIQLIEDNQLKDVKKLIKY